MLVFFLLSLVYKQVKYWAIPDLAIILQLALAMIAGTWFYTKVERPLLRKINGPGTRAAKIK